MTPRVVNGRHGNGGLPTNTARERQKAICRDYREEGKKRNPHFRGCIEAGGLVLGLSCGEDCEENCLRVPEPPPTLLHFAQANAVRFGMRPDKSSHG